MARGSRWLLRPFGAIGLLALVWLALGLREVPSGTIVVRDSRWLPVEVTRLEPGWTLAPPGVLRLSRYPTGPTATRLPDAEQAMVRAADGRRFGFRGTLTLLPRVEDWAALHEAAAGEGLEGVVLQAVREAGAGLDPGVPGGALSPAVSRELELRLAASFRRRGADFVRLELNGVDFLAADGPRTDVASTRLLVVGLDGADWAIVDRLVEQGRMPRLGGLVQRGVRAKLRSIVPMLSPVIWTSAATGVEPTRHGILDFLVDDPESGARQPVTSAQRLVPTFWEILSRAGVDVGVVGWWASWPADPVRGYLVSDRIAYQLFGFRADPADARGKTWPPDLYDDVLPLIEAPGDVPWARVQPYLAGERSSEERFDAEEREMLEDFRTLLASGDTYLSIARSLGARYRPRLEVVYFEGTDTVGHLFMPFRKPWRDGLDPRAAESFAEMVDRYYETADSFLGTLLDERGDDINVLVLSDHGFASDATRPRSTDSRIGHGAAADWHRRFGILVMAGPDVRSGVLLDEASIFDIAPTVLAMFGQPVPSSWPGKVLGQALNEEFLERHPVRYRDDDPARGEVASRGAPDPAAADLLAKLQALGYVAPEAAGASGADSVTARNNAGLALMAQGRYADAEAEFRAALALREEAPMARINLGIALRRQGKNDEAVACFEATIGVPGTRKVAGLALAEVRMESGAPAEAERIVRGLLEREPDAADVINTLGLVLEQQGRLPEAEAQFRRAAALDPDAALARNNLGNMLSRLGELEQAESWYLRAIEADPWFMGAYNNLALVYQTRGEMRRAIDLYGRALGKAPEDAVVLNNLASLHFEQGEIDRARELWERAARAAPGYASPLNNLASIAITEGRLDEAETLLGRALEIEPDYGDARVNLALIHRGRRRPDLAREELEQAVLDPRAAALAWSQMGYVALDVGNYEEAVRALTRALEAGPRNLEAMNALGEAHRRAGRVAEALAAWRRSLSYEPRQPRLQRAIAQLEAGQGR